MRLRRVLSGDRLAALIFLAVVVVYGGAGFTLTASLQGDIVGPAFFPRILTVLGLMLGVVLFVRGGRADAGKASAAGTDHDRDSDVTALVPAALLVGYALLFQPLGFLLATPLFLFATFRYFGQKGWLVTAACALAITTVTFGLFRYLLDLRLPLGPLAGLF